MFKAKLTKIRSNHSNLRTDVVEGITAHLPKLGESFVLTGEGLVFGSRVVMTSPVKNIEQMDNVFQFNTENSQYKLEILGEEECV